MKPSITRKNAGRGGGANFAKHHAPAREHRGLYTGGDHLQVIVGLSDVGLGLSWVHLIPRPLVPEAAYGIWDDRIRTNHQ